MFIYAGRLVALEMDLLVFLPKSCFLAGAHFLKPPKLAFSGKTASKVCLKNPKLAFSGKSVGRGWLTRSG